MEFSDNTGGAAFNMYFNHRGNRTTVRNEIDGVFNSLDDDRAGSSSLGTRSGIRRKKSAFRKIKETLATAALPIIQNGEIRRPGDYFRLFKTLEQEKPEWMSTVLLNKIFSGQVEEFNNFKSSSILSENPSESAQINYLSACVEWTYKFIDSDYISTFTNKEIDDYRKSIEMIVTEKRSEIKNYYLSKEFNLENFNSVLIYPNLLS